MSEKTTERTSDKQEKTVYFRFSASLRIAGEGLDFDEITKTLGVAPTHTHRKGDAAGRVAGRTFPGDMWSYKAPLERERRFEEHIMALWETLRPHVAYLRDLKQRFSVDVFCTYTSNSHTAGFVVDHRCLVLFTELEVPFGVSVVTV